MKLSVSDFTNELFLLVLLTITILNLINDTKLGI